MEKMRMRGVIVFLLVSTVILQSTTAFDLGCYKDCLIPCLSHGMEGLIVCFITCKKKCSGSMLGAHDTSNQQYCLLGCAATLCPHLNNNQEKIIGSTLLLPFLKFVNWCICIDLDYFWWMKLALTFVACDGHMW